MDALQRTSQRTRSTRNRTPLAATIECYLDLEQPGLPEPIVRWSSFNKPLSVYQGELEHKAQYMKRFLDLRTADGNYNTSKLEAVLDRLVRECVSIAEQKLMSSLI